MTSEKEKYYLIEFFFFFCRFHDVNLYYSKKLFINIKIYDYTKCFDT